MTQQVALEFPFAPVTKADEVFGGIPNYDEVLKTCPDEFRHNWQDSPWCDVVEHMFFHGVKPEEQDQFQIRAASQKECDMKMSYFRTWLGSFQPKHEDKIAVCGWLLSLMCTKVPVLTR